MNCDNKFYIPETIELIYIQGEALKTKHLNIFGTFEHTKNYNNESCLIRGGSIIMEE